MASQPNLVYIPGAKKSSVALDYRDAAEILSGQRKDTIGITTYSDLGPQARAFPCICSILTEQRVSRH